MTCCHSNTSSENTSAKAGVKTLNRRALCLNSLMYKKICAYVFLNIFDKGSK